MIEKFGCAKNRKNPGSSSWAGLIYAEAVTLFNKLDKPKTTLVADLVGTLVAKQLWPYRNTYDLNSTTGIGYRTTYKI